MCVYVWIVSYCDLCSLLFLQFKMPSEQVEEELREVTIVVRSLITSTKPPVSLANIERDYINVEQTPIPYRRLGFRNTLELLQETNAFDFQKFGNDVSNAHPKSAHCSRPCTLSTLFFFLSEYRVWQPLLRSLSSCTLRNLLSQPLSLSLWAQLFGGAVLLSFGQPLLRSIRFVASVGFVASARAVLCLPECLCASVSVCVHGAWLATKGQRVKARRCLIKKCKQSVCCLLICPRILCVYECLLYFADYSKHVGKKQKPKTIWRKIIAKKDTKKDGQYKLLALWLPTLSRALFLFRSLPSLTSHVYVRMFGESERNLLLYQTATTRARANTRRTALCCSCCCYCCPLLF